MRLRKTTRLGLLLLLLSAKALATDEAEKCIASFVLLTPSAEETEAFLTAVSSTHGERSLRRATGVTRFFSPPEYILSEATTSPDLWELSFTTRQGVTYSGPVATAETTQVRKDITVKAITVAPSDGTIPVRVPLSEINQNTLKITPRTLSIPKAVSDLPTHSQFADAAGVPYLVHKTDRESLPKLLQGGKLARQVWKDAEGNEVYKGLRSAVYFQPLEKGQLGQPPEVKNSPYLVFSNKLLDREDYYLNDEWDDHGALTPLSTLYTDKGGIRDRLWMLGGQTSKRDLRMEMVSLGPVSLEHLSAIVVPPGQKKRYVKEIQAGGVTTLNGRPIEELIVESADWPERSELP